MARATLDDVANAAGVSISTVSRYLSGELSLRPQTEQRVVKALDELKYRPKAPQGQAAQAKPIARVIGIAVPEVGNPFFGEAASQVIAAARSNNLAALTVSARPNSGHLSECLELLESYGVEGLVYIGNLGANDVINKLIRKGPPVVVLGEDIPGLPPVDTVLVDDYSGAYQATTHLLSQGHRSVAFVGGPEGLGSATERRRGWRDALVRTGIDPEQQFSVAGPYTPEFGAAALSRLLGSAERPTGVFVASDTVALGMLGAAQSFGVSIPDDLSLVGFDDAPASALVTPRLTTIKSPLHEMAETAVGLLMARIADPQRKPSKVVTPVAFVPGRSVAMAATIPAS